VALDSSLHSELQVVQRRLRESNPRPLRAAVFKTVSSTNRTVSFALSIKQRRPESNGLLLVQSESCAPLHYAASTSYRCQQALVESSDVQLVQSQLCDHYTKGQYG
jgi:hypothetical protein